jgi:hypothetical protein
MRIEQYLLKHKKKLARQWFDLLASTYPPETVRLLKKETNQFANPVGHALSTATEAIIDELLGQNSPEAMRPLLDRIIRIRAVQDFSPSSCVAFIFDLKTIAREVLDGESDVGDRIPDIGETNPRSATVSDIRLPPSDFDRKVDGLALLAFDVYARCREDLFEARMSELKNSTSRLVKLVNRET